MVQEGRGGASKNAQCGKNLRGFIFYAIADQQQGVIQPSPTAGCQDAAIVLLERFLIRLDRNCKWLPHYRQFYQVLILLNIGEACDPDHRGATRVALGEVAAAVAAICKEDEERWGEGGWGGITCVRYPEFNSHPLYLNRVSQTQHNIAETTPKKDCQA